jgi:hypothetical protein
MRYIAGGDVVDRSGCGRACVACCCVACVVTGVPAGDDGAEVSGKEVSGSCTLRGLESCVVSMGRLGCAMSLSLSWSKSCMSVPRGTREGPTAGASTSMAECASSNAFASPQKDTGWTIV